MGTGKPGFEYYRIAARLIPTEVREKSDDNRVMVVVQR